MRTTEGDRSESYDTDPAVRIVEDTIRAERHERRLYPDLYAERVVEALRAAGLLERPWSEERETYRLEPGCEACQMSMPRACHNHRGQA